MILIGATIRQVKTSVVMICVSLLTALTAGAPASAPGAGGGAAVHEGDEEAESTQRFDGKTLHSPSNNDNNVEAEQDDSKSCPLCSEKFPSQERLESHAMSVHSVNCEGLQRLQSLINGSHWLNKKDQGMLFFFFFFLSCILYQRKKNFIPQFKCESDG